MNAIVKRPTTQIIRSILSQFGALSKNAAALRDDDDLYEAGMTSHASVNVMIALENEFGIEFPDQMLTRSMFESIASMQSAVEELTTG